MEITHKTGFPLLFKLVLFNVKICFYNIVIILYIYQVAKREKKKGLQENMNKDRRKRIAKALDLISQAKDILEEVRDEEQDCYDNLPEGLQNAERGEQMQDNIDNLEEFISYLEETDSLEDM